MGGKQEKPSSDSTGGYLGFKKSILPNMERGGTFRGASESRSGRELNPGAGRSLGVWTCLRVRSASPSLFVAGLAASSFQVACEANCSALQCQMPSAGDLIRLGWGSPHSLRLDWLRLF